MHKLTNDLVAWLIFCIFAVSKSVSSFRRPIEKKAQENTALFTGDHNRFALRFKFLEHYFRLQNTFKYFNTLRPDPLIIPHFHYHQHGHDAFLPDRSLRLVVAVVAIGVIR